MSVLRAAPLVFQYVALQKKIRMKKSKKHVQFHSAKWFWPSIFAHDDEASTRHSKAQEQASSAAWCSL